MEFGWLFYLVVFVFGCAVGAVFGIWIAQEWLAEMSDEEIIEQINTERVKRNG